jgi:hypothetical protein
MICIAPLPIIVEQMPDDISDAAADAVAMLLLDMVERAENQTQGGQNNVD